MDQQFRNVKTHARLTSKSMWYEWRMKLLEGLREGLDKHVTGMDVDYMALRHEEALLTPMIQDLLSRHDALVEEVEGLRLRETEAENEDVDEKDKVRKRLAGVEKRLEERTTYLLQLERQQEENGRRVVAAKDLKEELEANIKEAERFRAENRGWSAKEVVEARGMLYFPFFCFVLKVVHDGRD
jgi:kinetochore protein Spc7/SPC105